MKNLVYIILYIFIFFSIKNESIANYAWENNKEWYIEKLLDLNYWIEEYNFQITEIKNIYFSDKNTQILYNSFRNWEKTLKDEFIRKYKKWEIDYYTMNWIIKNFNLFVYHTNRMFYYISLLEIRGDYKELDNAIIKNYENSRSYFNKTKLLIN